MISGNIRIAALIGNPVSHTLSPKLHNYWLNKYEIDGVYIPLQIETVDLAEVISSLPKIKITNFNVTSPFKEMIIPYLDGLDPLAQDIGAVNIVYQNSDGKLIGSNSDGYGFRRAIGNNRLPKGNASIIGSGGAARAIITELILNGNSEIEIVSRNQQKAEAIARGYQKIYDFKVRVVSTSDFQDTDVLINTIPTATDLSGLKNTALVIDTVYHPLDTDFLKEAQLRGNEIVPGLMMLIYQATIAFEMWFGVKPEVNQELYEYLK